MNLSEAKSKALSLMAEYSNDGVLIAAGENADYLNRMNRFANDAQFEIAEKVPIGATFTYEQVGSTDYSLNKVDLPADFKELRFVNLNDYRFTDYRIENGKFIISKRVDGSFDISYYKNPTELTSTTSDDYEFELDKHVHSLIPYYLGGMALASENSSLADRLLNMYYSKLSTATKRHTEQPTTIQSTYWD